MSIDKQTFPLGISAAVGGGCLVVGFGLGFVASRYLPRPVNLSQQKDSPKVATVVPVEELPDKQAFCRCWRSNNFPYCDGSHVAHNKKTGDNVGPLLIERRNKRGS